MNSPSTTFGSDYASAWSSQQPDSVAALFAEDASFVINGGDPAVGRHAITEVAREFMTGFPDLLVTCDQFEPEGDAYRWAWRMRGTFSGPGGTHQSIDIRGHEMIRFDATGLITAAEGFFDQADYDRQLGLDHSAQSPEEDA